MSRASLRNSIILTALLAVCLCLIPARADSVFPQGQTPEKEYIVHIVKWYEDLGSIAEKYGISAEIIMAYNGLKEARVERKQVLHIPLYPEKVIIGAAHAADGTPASADSLSGHRGVFPHSPDSVTSPENADSAAMAAAAVQERIRVSVALPLAAGSEKPNDSNYDFYSGVLLASKLLSETGLSVDLNVIDIADGLDTRALEGSDFVIGPVAAKDLQNAIDHSPKGLAFISPLDARSASLVDFNPSLIHAPTPAAAQMEDIVNWLGEEFQAGDEVFLFTEKDARPNAVASLLEQSGIVYHPISYGILQGRDIPDKLQGMMNTETVNRVLIASDSEAFVNDVVRNLKIMIHLMYNVVLYSPSRIRNFENIDAESCHNVQMRVSCSYYVDYDRADTKNFLLSYRALFGAEPGPFAYQGYDTMKYFASLVYGYGPAWMSMLTSSTVQGLQSDFRFEKKADGGFINRAVRRIIYEPDYSIRVVR